MVCQPHHQQPAAISHPFPIQTQYFPQSPHNPSPSPILLIRDTNSISPQQKTTTNTSNLNLDSYLESLTTVFGIRQISVSQPISCVRSLGTTDVTSMCRFGQGYPSPILLMPFPSHSLLVPPILHYHSVYTVFTNRT